MFLSTMYHHANSDKFSNSFEMLDKHFEFIHTNYKTILPGENHYGMNNICLVFDDGFFDFYYYVFPLLKKYNLKAILSIPTKYILKSTNIDTSTRLSVDHSSMIYDENKFLETACYCTWDELREMVGSGVVKIASHSVNHLDMRKLDTNSLEYELKQSKIIIEEKLGSICDTFVYPYGAYDNRVLEVTKKYYRYNIGINSKYNFNWDTTIGRIYADELICFDCIFSLKNKIVYLLGVLRALVPKQIKKLKKVIYAK